MMTKDDPSHFEMIDRHNKIYEARRRFKKIFYDTLAECDEYILLCADFSFDEPERIRVARKGGPADWYEKIIVPDIEHLVDEFCRKSEEEGSPCSVSRWVGQRQVATDSIWKAYELTGERTYTLVIS